MDFACQWEILQTGWYNYTTLVSLWPMFTPCVPSGREELKHHAWTCFKASRCCPMHLSSLDTDPTRLCACQVVKPAPSRPQYPLLHISGDKQLLDVTLAWKWLCSLSHLRVNDSLFWICAAVQNRARLFTTSFIRSQQMKILTGSEAKFLVTSCPSLSWSHDTIDHDSVRC